MRGVCPACIVGVKVTSHIGLEKTGGDLFLTVCDYEWKPLGFFRSLIGGVFARISDGFSLTTCGATLSIRPGRNGMPLRLRFSAACAASTNACHGHV
ncbi:hypothetical protein F3J12_11160 [Burkholderia sp. Ax-1735]|nr:hypothetical protein [Burkholderia sp. Ap-955]NIF10094.1 hypothetical protein [Burkholderia sp. Ax-1735]NIG03387.1 hypothetical protein [Burkholderia sp. Tr-849]